MLADAYGARHAAGAAVRYVRPVVKWGATRGTSVPGLRTLYLPVPVKRRRRILTRDEIAAVLPVLRASDRPHGAAMRFMLLTLTRRQESALARWRDVNMEARTWTIPETKNGEMHVVPLSRQAIDLLRSRLPVDDADNLKHPDPSALIFATSTGAPLGNWDRETKTLQGASGTEGWTRHDLRRTGATMLGKMGELPDIIEAALNHGASARLWPRPTIAAAIGRRSPRRCNGWRMRWTGSRRGRRRWCRCALGTDVSIDLSPPVPHRSLLTRSDSATCLKLPPRRTILAAEKSGRIAGLPRQSLPFRVRSAELAPSVSVYGIPAEFRRAHQQRQGVERWYGLQSLALSASIVAVCVAGVLQRQCNYRSRSG